MSNTCFFYLCFWTNSINSIIPCRSIYIIVPNNIFKAYRCSFLQWRSSKILIPNFFPWWEPKIESKKSLDCEVPTTYSLRCWYKNFQCDSKNRMITNSVTGCPIYFDFYYETILSIFYNHLAVIENRLNKSCFLNLRRKI